MFQATYPNFGLTTQVRFALALVLFLIAFGRVVEAGEIVVDEKLGFSIELPDNWVRMNASSFYENLGNLKLDNKDFQKALQKSANIPVVIATKHEEPFNDVNPSIKVNARPYGNLPTKDPVEIVSLISAPLKKLFKNVKVVTEPNKILLNGTQAGHVSIEYTIETDAGSFPVGSELLIVPSEHFFYMVGIGYKQGDMVEAGVAKAAAMSFKLVTVAE